MRILVVTSCTGEKAVEVTDQLTLEDFKKGPGHVAQCEARLIAQMMPAESLYTGIQHLRLMRGIRAARTVQNLDVDLHIVSAGYGLVPGARRLAPYEATFIGMSSPEAQDWANRLALARDARNLLAQRYDLGLVLLGDDYLKALALDKDIVLGGPTILFCGKGAAARLPVLNDLRLVVLANKDATRFSCGLVGIKGELARRLLERIAADPSEIVSFTKSERDVLEQLENVVPKAPTTGALPRAESAVDRVIEIPAPWWNKLHRKKLCYFIPEWDDLVDPDYDFAQDTHSGGTGNWANEVYAHQMYPEPNYDGILISKVVAEKSKLLAPAEN